VKIAVGQVTRACCRASYWQRRYRRA